jgi:hypothetical protein
MLFPPAAAKFYSSLDGTAVGSAGLALEIGNPLGLRISGRTIAGARKPLNGGVSPAFHESPDVAVAESQRVAFELGVDLGGDGKIDTLGRERI